MNKYTRTLRTLMLTLGLGICATSHAYTLYDDPFELQPYVSNPADIIKQGITSSKWQVANESPGKIEALWDHKGYRLVLNIHYDTSKIWFEAVSAENNGCKKQPCEVEQRHVDRWRLDLRRWIAQKLTDEAIRDANRQIYQGGQ